MVAFLLFLLNLFDLLFKSKSQLAAENVALRQQVIALQRKVRGRVQLTDNDRLFFIQLYRWFPSVLNAITIVRPETLCAGIARASVATGAGNPGIAEDGHPSRANCGH